MNGRNYPMEELVTADPDEYLDILKDPSGETETFDLNGKKVDGWPA